MESDILVPHGLWGGDGTTTLDAIAKFLTTNNFNAVRLPLAVDAVLSNKEVTLSKIINEKKLQTSFSGKTLHYFDVLDYVLDVFAQHKILVLLDCHLLVAGTSITPLCGNKTFGAAMVVGEWGGSYETQDDQTWQKAFVKYLENKGLSWFYWCVNPNSGDTEGLLGNDWTTPRTDKISLLAGFKGSVVP
uniref:Glycoside hydrolase family 5 domain-containing protein n=1 Tax=Globisporangium ultimum (strain ATCC 200006 / CBS 805.95 / DAOM BR144) TaxID=431595 RepID=K3X5L1_GLOUD